MFKFTMQSLISCTISKHLLLWCHGSGCRRPAPALWQLPEYDAIARLTHVPLGTTCRCALLLGVMAAHALHQHLRCCEACLVETFLQ